VAVIEMIIRGFARIFHQNSQDTNHRRRRVCFCAQNAVFRRR